jgi:AcrR family transcriptional regulator
MPKISQAKRDARRQQILDAALKCFSRDGFHATTTADIVRESGVSQGTLYLYFANKDDIVVALADDRRQGEAFLSALAHREPDPIRGLLSFIDLHAAGLADFDREPIRRVGVQGWAEALLNPRVHASTLEGVTLVRQAIIRLIERGQRTGQMRADVDPDTVARTLIATFQGFVLQIAWGESLNRAACGRVMLDLIEGILLTPAGRASIENATPRSVSAPAPAP